MPSPVVHFEIRSPDPDATRSFFGKLFGWTFPDGGIPDYSYVDTESRARYPVASARCRTARPWSRFSSGSRTSPLPWTPRWRRAERSSRPRHRCRGSPSGCWPTRRGKWWDWPRRTAEATGGGPAGLGQPTAGRLWCLILLTLPCSPGPPPETTPAFAELVEPFRRPVFRHCYRMLGSGADAEDATEDTLERAWRKLAAWSTARDALGAWLQRIATNICLDGLRARRTRIGPVGYGPPAAPGTMPWAARPGAGLGRAGERL